MNRRRATFLALTCFALAGCGLLPSGIRHTTTPATLPPPPAMTSVQMAGQRVLYSYSGLTPPESLLRLIRHGEAAGVVFFADNISSQTQLAAVCRQLQQANSYRLNPVRGYPLILAVDQEGGPVRRLAGAPTLSEKQIGASSDPEAQASGAGQQAGRNLRGAGLNVDLAPVLDVFRSSGDFIDHYGRSYSSIPAAVGRLGEDFVSALQSGGVAATAKHFPGLGVAVTQQNTDFGPVALSISLDALRAADELPYRAAVAAGVKLVMLSWASYSAFHSSLPAGLNSQAVSELRGRLHFAGVTVTDTLEAGALASYGSVGGRAFLAAGAGMDLMLTSGGSLADGNAVRGALQGNYDSGRLSHAAFAAAVARILALRASLR